MAQVPPQGDQPLNVWLENFAAKLTATPTAFGATAADATLISAAATDFAARMVLIDNPATRNKITVANKNVAKKSATAKARQVLKVISAFPALTPGQREDLRMNPKDSTKTPIPAPSFKPAVSIAADGSIRLWDPLFPERRSRPSGVNGAAISMKIDGPAPISPADGHLAALLTRSRGQLPLPAGSNGKVLWVIAQWYNERGELGPASDPVGVTIAA
ncbi:MAG: hypothetical protein JWN40_3753 [Phycisphaerales bacterium]|nr:hypothetical protein [Phycisphaerales bacterium]